MNRSIPPHPPYRRAALALALYAGLLAAPARAAECSETAAADPAAATAPGTVLYRTGGVGHDEAQAMRADRLHYPLALTFVVHEGATDYFTAGVRVEVLREDGGRAFCAVSEGPYLFMQLPPGRYRVQATADDGRTQLREVTLAAGSRQDLSFRWSGERVSQASRPTPVGAHLPPLRRYEPDNEPGTSLP